MARTWRAGSKARAAKLGLALELPSIDEVESYLRNLPLRCSYCERKLSAAKSSKPQMDHRIPIDRWLRRPEVDLEIGTTTVVVSGAAGTANLALACRGCNLSKGNMTEEEFRALRGLVSTWADQGRDLFRRLKLGWFSH